MFDVDWQFGNLTILLLHIGVMRGNMLAGTLLMVAVHPERYRGHVREQLLDHATKRCVRRHRILQKTKNKKQKSHPISEK